MLRSKLLSLLSEQFGEKRLVLSEGAVKGGENLLVRIQSEDLRMEILPNNYSQFTGELEERNFLSFTRFVNSVYGKRLIKHLEEQDEGELA